MNCQEIQLQLLKNNSECSDEIRRHLTSCRECRQFQQTLLLTQHCQYNANEMITLAICKQNLKQRNALHRQFKRLFMTAAAAVVVIVGVVIFNSSPATAPVEQSVALITTPAPVIDSTNNFEDDWQYDINDMDYELDFLESNINLLACGF